MANTKKKKKWLPILIIILLFIIAMGAGLFFVYNTGIFRLIKIDDIDGDVTVNKETAIDGMNLKSGDVVKTDDDSSVGLLIDSDKHILATENTKFEVKGKGTSFFGGMAIELLYGDALIEIDNKLNNNSTFIVNTPNASLSVRGTTFRTVYSDDDETTAVYVEEGKVKVDTKKDSVTLKEGESALVMDDKIYTDALVPSDTDMSKVNVGDTVYWGLYEQDNDLDNGTEPVEWVVIDADDDSVLLMSKYIIDVHKYNSEYNHDEGETSFWYNSELREYLNDDFFNLAFTDYEQNFMIMNHIEPDTEYIKLRDGDKETDDYVYLLSYDDIAKYFEIEENDVLGSFYTWTVPEMTSILTPYANEILDTHYTVDERIIREYRLPEEYLDQPIKDTWLRRAQNNNSANYVGAFGLINDNSISMSDVLGLRPVIRVSR